MIKRKYLAVCVLTALWFTALFVAVPASAQPPDAVQAFTADPRVAAMLAQVTSAQVYTYTAQLSGETPVIVGGTLYTFTTRNTSSGVPIQKATQFVYEHLQQQGLAASYHNWTNCSRSNRNVVGVLTGTVTPNEIVLITAHLDNMPSSGRAPGADDNASGSVGVMLAAEIMKNYRFERTVRFVYFTGEEQGLCGSEMYANLVYANGENIVAVYNMDMIAYDALNGPTLRLHTRTTGNPGYAGDVAIAGVFTNVVASYGLNLTPIIDADSENRSDHSSFWDVGYAAILAIEDDASSGGDFNPYYHTINDSLANINLTYFTNYVKASVGTAAHLARLVNDQAVLRGTVINQANAQPIVGAQVQAINATQSYLTSTVSGGLYSLSVPSETYTVTAFAPGYMRFITTGVALITNQTTTLNIALEVTPTYVITGYVHDVYTQQPLGAQITLSGTGQTANTHPATGYYSLTAQMPSGSYILSASAPGYAPLNRLILLNTHQQQNFDLAPICLLVVDGDGGANYDTYYTTALDQLGKSYVRITAAPTLTTLQQYDGVIWLTGNNGTLSSIDQTALSAYLNGGGRLFISGQDLGYSIESSAFYTDYLHSRFQTDNTGIFTLTGQSFLAGLNVNIKGAGGANNQFYPDGISAQPEGTAAYQYNGSSLLGGVAYSGTHRTVNFSFGFEGITSANQRQAVMSATLNYLGVCQTPHAPTADFTADVNVQTAVFTNTTTGSPFMTYLWDFGDGLTSTASTPQVGHVYAQGGAYTVTLTATNAYGSDVFAHMLNVADFFTVYLPLTLK
jgi:Zn-dependent M28 family amino/carboxypeptidase